LNHLAALSKNLKLERTLNGTFLLPQRVEGGIWHPVHQQTFEVSIEVALTVRLAGIL